MTARVFDANNRSINYAVVTWSSRNSGIATVNAQGLVTAVKNGKVRITARSGGAMNSIEVTVSQTAASIVIEPSPILLTAIAETVQLTAKVLDSKMMPVETLL